MGKASIRRKAYQKKRDLAEFLQKKAEFLQKKRNFVELSHKNPELFEAKWVMEMESMLTEAKGRSWSMHSLVFEILDHAMEILESCNQIVAERVKLRTYKELSHECSAAVANAVDGRLYHLSNTYDMMQLGRKSREEKHVG
jgi:hypothetical protein